RSYHAVESHRRRDPEHRVKASTFLIFIVSDPKGLTRGGEHLSVGAKFAVKRTSSRVHVNRWLAAKRLRFVHAVPGTCGVCGCTEEKCAGCIARTGQPCHWLDPERTVCSA